MTYRALPRRAGFTLIELMITVLVGSIVLVGIFTIFNASSRGYRVQDQTLQAMGQLRSATVQVRSDLRNAGFNAPAHSAQEPWVTVPPPEVLTAVSVEVDPLNPLPNQAENDNVSPQRITLLGDFVANETFRSLGITGSDVTVEWSPARTEAEFDRIFNPNHLLRVEMYGTARREQFIPITSTSFNGGVNPVITVASPVLDILGFGAGHEVSVAAYVRYRIQRDDRYNDDSVKTDLVRELLDVTGTAVPGSMLVIAEYVVDLQVYDLCFNQTPPDAFDWAQEPVNNICFETLADAEAGGFSLNPNDANSTAHLLRLMTVKIATRTPYENENVPFVARANVNDPLRAFELDPVMDGAARVVETAVTTFMASIQARRR